MPAGSVVDIRLPNVQPNVFEEIITYIYGTTLTKLLDMDDQLALMKQAQEWGLDDLTSLCVSKIRVMKKTGKELVQLILKTREMPDDPHTKLLADTAKRELMALDFNAIQSVDIRPLGQVYLANLFKSLRRFEVLAMQDYEPPNLALRFARDICNPNLEYSDFKIRVGNDVIYSFKCILYARSHYFKRLLEAAQSPSEVVVNVSPEVMRLVHTFLLSDVSMLESLDGDLAKVYELIAALDVFKPTSPNCLHAALKYLREKRSSAARVVA